MMSTEDIERYVKEIEKEKQDEAAKKKTRGGGTSLQPQGEGSST
jgi:20S proteasome subunit alpha 4